MRGPPLKALNDLVQGGQPTRHQVAVCQEHPVALAHPVLDQPSGELRLSLSQSHAEKVVYHATFLCQLAQVVRGVYARREHKDEGGGGCGVLVGLSEVQDRGLHKLPAERVGHVAGGAEDDTVWAEAPHQQQTLELIAFGLPLAGKLCCLRLFLPVPALPLPIGGLHGGNYALEVHQVLQLRDIVPCFLCNPQWGWVVRLLGAVQDCAAL
mmetsp:Transcript_14243/g.38603  ORF Transcript_14243/g.38603 Transcript_14243/m.38603 type:complete len:210 (-) Transcript_14243:8140-8769(-)